MWNACNLPLSERNGICSLGTECRALVGAFLPLWLDCRGRWLLSKPQNLRKTILHGSFPTEKCKISVWDLWIFADIWALPAIGTWRKTLPGNLDKRVFYSADPQWNRRNTAKKKRDEVEWVIRLLFAPRAMCRRAGRETKYSVCQRHIS